ncbi:hypothetical protein GCM10010168_49640 [Actinoplanes ianthinogenes]|uniref:WCX domain-containing protein n=1 Tax=Actinoplanes ianthinogenes TaxID=122358 RepID=A0ABM7M3D2_9ACTN|nr:hypothetical protein Aiant_66730 [Actinoplanes ianthinogenes]GGR25699.1 hypothetical protein GCM10010168_49640 [Actinoplanes ianthinogenes]
MDQPRAGRADGDHRPHGPARHRPDGPDATIVEIGGNDADRLATYLLGLGTTLRVLSPDRVREALLRRTRDLFEQNEGGQPR